MFIGFVGATMSKASHSCWNAIVLPVGCFVYGVVRFFYGVVRSIYCVVR